MLTRIIDWLFPYFCLICGLKSKADICKPCSQELPTLDHICLTCATELKIATISQCGECLIDPPLYDLTVVLFQYRFPIPSLITKLKFNQKLLFAGPLGNMLAEKVKQTYRETSRHLPEVILPVPLSKKRLRERGYNQALEIARPISRCLHIPIDFKSLARVRATMPQTRINREERLINVKNSFKFNNYSRYQHVAVIDDVATTYSTLSEIARTLKNNQVKTVDTWCLAKA